ncbi:MAG: hypothetical protein V1743_04835 [Nanoarchaeota archaeon]
MEQITDSEMKVMLALFRDMSVRYNAHTLSKKVRLSHMGTLKILKKLERKRIAISQQLGRAAFYALDWENPFTQEYIEFLLQKEAEESIPRVKRWVRELGKLRDAAEIAILFGSVLRTDHYNDIDVVIVLKQPQLQKLSKLVDEINAVNLKKIHLVKQTRNDLIGNIRKKDPVLLAALQGTVVFGHHAFCELVRHATQPR